MVDLTETFRLYNGPLVIEGAAGYMAERWAGLEAWASKTSVAEIPALIEAVYGGGPGSASLWAAIQMHDEAFSPALGSAAARLMSAAALDYLFTHNATLDVAAALAVTSSAFGGRKPENLPVDLVGRAEAELDAVADQRRERGGLTDVITAIKTEPQASKAIADINAEFSGEKVAVALNDVLKIVGKALDKIAAETRRALLKAEKQIALCDEEANVLWFVFGGDSTNAERPFKDLPSGEAAIFAATELAAMTTIPLHSQMFQALLARLGIAAGNVPLKAAVEALTPSWIGALVQREPDPRLYPLHRLMDRYREFGTSGAAWSKGLQEVIGIPPSMKLGSAALALQFYRELMLKKALVT